MRLGRNINTRISIVILGITIIVWVLLLFNPGHIMTIEHCLVSDSGPSKASFQMLLDMNPVSSQLTGWGLMVIAMMLPKLIFPVRDIYERSLPRYRLPLSLLFLSGYIAAWMVVGLVMMTVILGLHLLMPGSFLPATGLGIIAMVWQFSPAKQRCLNRGHDHRTLAAFGWPAHRDAWLFGIMHGVWCVGSGWAIMLLPMLLPSGHNMAMIVVTLVMISEHMEHPQIPRWRINPRTKLFRIVAAQTQRRWTKFLTI
jgi:predicted metal-binding membrane protein